MLVSVDTSVWSCPDTGGFVGEGCRTVSTLPTQAARHRRHEREGQRMEAEEWAFGGKKFGTEKKGDSADDAHGGHI